MQRRQRFRPIVLPAMAGKQRRPILGERMREIRSYESEIFKAFRAMRQGVTDVQAIYSISELALRMGVPKEKFAESVKQILEETIAEQGSKGINPRIVIQKTWQQLTQIRKIALALKKSPEEIRRMFQQGTVSEVFEELAGQYQQAKQAGMVA